MVKLTNSLKTNEKIKISENSKKPKKSTSKNEDDNDDEENEDDEDDFWDDEDIKEAVKNLKNCLSKKK